MTKYAAYNLFTRKWSVKVKTASGCWFEAYSTGSRRAAYARLAAI